MSRQAINDLRPGTNYQIQVRAVAADAVSEWSRVFDVTTIIDTTKPKVPANVTWVYSGDSFHGEWDTVIQNVNSENIVTDHYDVELTSGATVKTLTVAHGASRLSLDLSFEANRALFGSAKAGISMRVRAVDSKGLAGDYSTSITATNPVPAPVTGLTATAITDGVFLKWTAPADTDLVGYNLYVGASANPSSKVNNKPISTTEWNYGTTTYSQQYFKVTAVDKFGQESTGVEVTATPKSPYVVDAVAPATPTSLAGSITNNANGIGARASLTWAQTTVSDLAGFYVRYRKVGDTVYSNVTFQKDDRAGIVELQSGFTNYEFQIKSFDWTNNESAWSATTTLTSPANTAPAQVTGVDSVAGRDSIRLSWTPATEADLKEYEVTFSTSSTFASGNVTFRTGNSAVLDIGGLTPATTYYMRVRAIDAGGLTGPFSTTHTKATLAQLTPGDIGAPTTTQFNNLSGKVDDSIASYVTEYAVNSSESTAPTTGWSETTPTRNAGQFIWIRTKVTYHDGLSTTTNPALLTGNTGATGDQGIQGPAGTDGQSLYTWIKYADTPTTGMSDSPTGKTYIGIAVNKATSTESSTYSDYTWSLIKGDQGIQGPAGTDGQPTYTWIKYGTSSTGTGISDDPTGKTYIGLAHNKTTATESTNAADYTWSLFQGPQGSQGIQGPAGSDGVTYYTWLKYADSPTTGMSDSPTGKTYMGLAYNKTSATESTNYADYAWSLIKGADGSDGADGVQGPAGADGTTTYTWVKYGDDASGAGMSDSPTGKTYIGLAFNKTTATESTTATDYQWSLIQGAAGANGVSATSVVVGNDAVAIPTTAAGAATAAGTITIPFSGWVGSTRVAATMANPTLPSGITLSSNTAATSSADGSLILAYANGATIGSSSSGQITLNVTANGQTFPHIFSWARALTGAQGGAGVSATSIDATPDVFVVPTNSAGAALAAGSANVTIKGFVGSTASTVTPAANPTMPAGITVNTPTAGTTVTLTFSWANGASIGSTASGTITWNMTVNGITFPINIGWARATGGTNGTNGVSVTGVKPFFARVTTGSTPTQPPNGTAPIAPWQETEPTWTSGTELWRTEQVSYSSGTTPVYTLQTKVATYGAITTAITAANGKNQVVFSNVDATGTADAGGVAYIDGDLWFKRDVNGIVLGTWEFISGGTGWVIRKFGDATLDSLNVGKLVSGDISAALVKITSTGAIQSTNYAAGSTGWRLNASGLEINNGSVKASALIGDTLTSSTGKIQIGAGASIVTNGGVIRSNTYGSDTYNAAATAGFFLSDGNLHIPDGNISAKALKTGTISGTTTIELSGSNAVIQSAGYNGTAGFKLSGNGLEIPEGSLQASKIIITSTFSQNVQNQVTTIDGSKITTGEIRSSEFATKYDSATGTYVVDSTKPAWFINTTGAAEFNNLSVRGNVVVGDVTETPSTTTDADGNVTQAPDGQRSTIASGNYLPGSRGWILRSDGYAEFRNLLADSIDGEVIKADTLDVRVLKGQSVLGENQTIYVEGALTARNNVEGSEGYGSTVSLSGDGFFVRGSNALGNPEYIVFPTSGAPNIISGTLQASTLSVNGLLDPDTGKLQGATFRGSNNLELGSDLALLNAVAAPIAAPSVTESLPYLTLENNYYDDNGPMKHADNALHLTDYVNAATVQNKVLSYDDVTGEYLGEVVVPNPSGGGSFRALLAIARHGANWFGLWAVGTDTKLVKYDANWVPVGVEVVIQVLPGALEQLASDGTHILYFNMDDDATGAARNPKVRKFDPNTLAVVGSDITLTTPPPPATNSKEWLRIAGFEAGNFDYGTYTFLLGWDNMDTSGVYAYDSAGTRQTSREWPVEAPTSGMKGFTVDPTNNYFYGRQGSNVFEYSGEMWTTESPSWWFGYSWFQSSGRSVGGITTTTGSTTITDGTNTFKTSDIGAEISGAGIPSGATISSVAADGSTATLSAAATATGTITVTISYETTTSPLANIAARKKRRQWTITGSAGPSGTVLRTYIGRGSTAPTSTGMYHQNTLAAGKISDWDSRAVFSGKTAKSTGTFATGTPAKIYSQQTDSLAVAGVSTTNGSTTISLPGGGADFYAYYLGAEVTGNGIPAGAKIVTFTNSNTVVLSKAATATATGVTVNIVRPNIELRGDGFARISELNAQRTILTSTSEADFSGNNVPPLRIGDINGVHLRMDSNEIIAMATPTTKGDFQIAAESITLSPSSGGLRIEGGALFAGKIRATSNLHTSVILDYNAVGIATAGFNGGTYNANNTVGLWVNNINAFGAITTTQNIQMENPTLGSFTANVNWNSTNGFLRVVSSSKRFKENIEDAVIDTAKVLALKPRTFQRNDEWTDDKEPKFIGYREDNPTYVGFIAEEAQELGLTDWVEYDADGTPVSFAYANWPVALQAVAREHEEEIKKLKKENKTLRSEIKEIRSALGLDK